ncbi:MAG: uroporphyrinogen-III C-methyltransferase [Gammaproteobacteria bacterium]|nr:uroporphyrinogen-III C-methyltransferase [Gammaproteobacteria bacterium]
MANTLPPAPSTKKSRRPAAEEGSGRRGRVTAGLSLILALIALTLSGYVGYLVNSKRGLSDAKGRLVNVEKETAQLQEFSARITRDLGSLRESQKTLDESLQALHNEVGKDRRAWLVAETENLLVIAQHRLRYARDARLAIEALRAADQQLALLGDPAFQPVRRQIETELGALTAYEQLDLTGLARRLGQLAATVTTLPLAPPKPAAEPSPAEEGILREIWRDLRDLVRVRSTTDIRRPLLLPEHKYYLHENLRLALQSAGFAMLHGDSTTFGLNARIARQWIQDQYDTRHPAVQAAVSELDAALRVQALTLPDLAGSLNLLREIRSRHGVP